ncbi:hypothetical protein [Trichormus sp. NMC-1]|nr:hypothetical protein [Trichormus sp. NMC-1]
MDGFPGIKQLPFRSQNAYEMKNREKQDFIKIIKFDSKSLYCPDLEYSLS